MSDNFETCSHCGGAGFISKKMFHGNNVEKDPIDLPCGYCMKSGVVMTKMSPKEIKLRQSEELRLL